MFYHKKELVYGLISAVENMKETNADKKECALAIKKALQNLWDNRKLLNRNLIHIVNFIQIALFNVDVSNLDDSKLEALLKSAEIMLRPMLYREDINLCLITLARSGLDPWPKTSGIFKNE